MKIEQVKNEVTNSFGGLKIGDAFTPVNHLLTDLYIKTYDFECERVYEGSEDDQYNAIKLSNGKPYWFSSFDKVVIPNCKIMVE